VTEIPGVKAILGYDIVEGMPVEDYERWLWDEHYPDLLANPYLDRVVLNTVDRPITTTSAGTATAGDAAPFARIAELHFADHEAYENYLRWFEEHPIPVERSPQGRSVFHFYVLCDVSEASRDSG
jgi:hypothetical protein